MKRLGNQKPLAILELERTVWDAVFGISSGKHSAISAFFKLHDGWVNEDWEVRLSAEDRRFFARGQYALQNDERFGIWGGLSERERRKLKKRAV